MLLNCYERGASFKKGWEPIIYNIDHNRGLGLSPSGGVATAVKVFFEKCGYIVYFVAPNFILKKMNRHLKGSSVLFN